jgi:hypothetical protein
MSKFSDIKKMSAADRKEIHKFAMRRSREMMGEKEDKKQDAFLATLEKVQDYFESFFKDECTLFGFLAENFSKKALVGYIIKLEQDKRRDEKLRVEMVNDEFDAIIETRLAMRKLREEIEK